MQDWRATARYRVTRKRRRQRLKANKNEPKDKKCLLSLGLKLLRSYVRGKHSAKNSRL